MGTKAERTNHRDANAPADGLWFGRKPSAPVGPGELVTFTRHGRGLSVHNLAGELVDSFGDTAKFWYAPAPVAEATADQIEQAAIDAAHAEADYDNYMAGQIRDDQGSATRSAARRGLLGTALYLRSLRSTLDVEGSRAGSAGRRLLAEALLARVAELAVEVANAEYAYAVDCHTRTTVKAPPATVVEASVEQVVIVPCGGRKLAEAATAGELYTGSYHLAMRRAADAIAGPSGARVFILSALHGLLTLEQVVEPYNLRMGQPGSVDVDQVRRQAAALGIRAAAVTVLAGRAYADLVSAVWPDAVRPLDGTRGIGPQLSRLKAIAETGELARPAPAGLVGEQLALFDLPALDLPAGDLAGPPRTRRARRGLSARAFTCPRLFALVGT